MIRIGVFDFDGTLVDSNDIKMKGFFRLAAQYPGGKAAMTRAIRNSGDRCSILSEFTAHMASTGERLNVEKLVAHYNRYVDAAVSVAPEMEGATDLLVNLRDAGLRLYISSATPVTSLLPILDTRGWTVLFNGIYGSPSTKLETLYKIKNTENASGQEIVVVGDGIEDAYAAESIGTEFFAVGFGSYAVTYPGTPTLTLRDVSGLILGSGQRAGVLLP